MICSKYGTINYNYSNTQGLILSTFLDKINQKTFIKIRINEIYDFLITDKCSLTNTQNDKNVPSILFLYSTVKILKIVYN